MVRTIEYKLHRVAICLSRSIYVNRGCDILLCIQKFTVDRQLGFALPSYGGGGGPSLPHLVRDTGQALDSMLTGHWAPLMLLVRCANLCLCKKPQLGQQEHGDGVLSHQVQHLAAPGSACS